MTVDVYKVKYTTVTGCRFDSAAFKKTHGDLYAQYSKPTVTRRFSVAYGYRLQNADFRPHTVYPSNYSAKYIKALYGLKIRQIAVLA